MRKLLLPLLCLILTSACSSDDDPAPAVGSDVDNSGLSMTPLANIEFNDSNFGIYKGVVVGPSGTIVINLLNNGQLSADVTIDGQTTTYTSSDSPVLNQDISNLTFTNGVNSFQFSVSGAGIDPQLTNIYFENYPDTDIEVIKEYSDALVRCYTGSFQGSKTGDFNIMRIENSIYGLQKFSDDEHSYYFEGMLATPNYNITGTLVGGTFTGLANGATFSGDWTKAGQQSGTWTVQRAL